MEYTIGAIQSVETIFSGILVGEITRNNPCLNDKMAIARVCLSRLKEAIPVNVFYNEFAIFYDILVDKKVHVFKNSQLQDIIGSSRDIIEKSPNILFDKYITDIERQPNRDELIYLFTQDVMKMNTELSNRYVTEEEFMSSLESFKIWYSNELAVECANNGALIMSDAGFDWRISSKKTKHMQGYAAYKEYTRHIDNLISSLDGTHSVTGYVVDEKWLSEDLKKKEDDYGIFTIGINEIDRVLGELRRTNLLGIIGPPKSGKTRFTAFLCARALMLGLNVAVWVVEGSSQEWEAMIVACIMAMLQVDADVGRDETGRRNFVYSNVILHRKYPNKDVEKEVNAVKTMLATGGMNIGRLSFMRGSLKESTYLDDINEHYENKNPFDVIVVDSLINGICDVSKNKSTGLSSIYMGFKDYLTNKMKVPAIGIVPCQLKQEEITKMEGTKGRKLGITSGGETAETIRTPDTTIGIYTTDEEKKAGKLHLYSVCSRHTDDFEDFCVNAIFGSAYFFSNESTK